MNTTRRDFLKLSTLAATIQIPRLEKSGRVSGVSSAKTPTILLRSSWNDNNIGDIGHTPGTLRLLERHIPDAQIILWHAQPRPVTEALIARNFPKVKIVHGAFFNQDEGLQGELKTAFGQADIYIHNSGMSMNYGLFNYEWTGTMANLAPFYYCIENNIPFGLYGQSFDKFAPPSLSLYRDVLSRASFIYCRDTESVKFLKENKFKTPIIEFGPDGCFGIDVRDEARGLAYLRQAGLEEGRFLVVVIRTNTPHLNAAGKGDESCSYTRTAGTGCAAIGQSQGVNQQLGYHYGHERPDCSRSVERNQIRQDDALRQAGRTYKGQSRMPGNLLECRRSHVGLCQGAHNVRHGAPFADHGPGIGRAGSSCPFTQTWPEGVDVSGYWRTGVAF